MEDVLGPRRLAAGRSGAVILVWFLLGVFGVGVSCRVLCSVDSYLYVGCGGSVASIGGANLSAVVCVWWCGFCSGRFPLPLGAWDGSSLM